MRIRFFVSSGDSFSAEAPDGSDEECCALPRHSDRIAFWRDKAGDERVCGHALVWQVDA